MTLVFSSLQCVPKEPSDVMEGLLNNVRVVSKSACTESGTQSVMISGVPTDVEVVYSQ